MPGIPPVQKNDEKKSFVCHHCKEDTAYENGVCVKDLPPIEHGIFYEYCKFCIEKIANVQCVVEVDGIYYIC